MTSKQEEARQPGLDLGPPPEWADAVVPVKLIREANWGSPPDEGMLRSVEIHGVFTPVLLRRDGKSFVVIDGRRRTRAARHVGVREVPARVLVDGNLGLTDSAVALAGNVHASPNPVVELELIEEIMRTAEGTPSAVVIARDTGIPLKTIRKRMRLASLSNPIRNAWLDGRIGTKAGEAAARCDEEQQRELARRLQANGTIRYEDVVEVRQSRVRPHQRTLVADRVAERIAEQLEKAIKAASEAWGDCILVDHLNLALEAVRAINQ
jgi:ParB/RepB/Spo0J family partition protein